MISSAPRAAIYARYSSEHQREASLEDQIRICRRLIAEKGYDQVTVDDIAAACGIGRGTLYHYFPGKDANGAQPATKP